MGLRSSSSSTSELRVSCAELGYWRSRAGQEVDFIVGDAIAIEVKATDNVTDRHTKGMRALREEGLLRRYLMVCQESRPRVADGIEVLPWREFAVQLWRIVCCAIEPALR